MVVQCVNLICRADSWRKPGMNPICSRCVCAKCAVFTLRPVARWPWRQSFLVLMGCLIACPVRADADDSFSLFVAETVVRDSNLFRLDEGAAPPLALGGNGARDDTVRIDTLGMSFDKAYSLQRFHLGFSLANQSYRRYRFLDMQARNAEARWNWSVTPHLTGRMVSRRSETLNSFVDYRSFVRNVNVNSAHDVSFQYGAYQTWRLVGAAGHSKSQNAAYVQQTGDTASDSGQLGIKYVTTANNTLTLLTRTARTEWLHRTPATLTQLDNRATQNDLELQALWNPGGKSRVQATLTRLKRTHEHFAARDYRGTAGQLDYTWNAGGSTQLQILAQRSYAPWWEATSSYSINRNLVVSPLWQWSVRTAVKARLERGVRDYQGPIVPLPFALRQDQTRKEKLTVSWAPIKSLLLEASLQNEHRTSNFAGLGYRDKTLDCTIQLSF